MSTLIRAPSLATATVLVVVAAALTTAAHGQQGLAATVSRQLFEQMLLHRNDPACPARGFYTYEAFIAAASTFPEFGTTGGGRSPRSWARPPTRPPAGSPRRPTAPTRGATASTGS
jgi:hypothetical protein